MGKWFFPVNTGTFAPKYIHWLGRQPSVSISLAVPSVRQVSEQAEPDT